MSRTAFRRRTALGLFALGLALALLLLPNRAGRAGDRFEGPQAIASTPVISLQQLALGLGPMTYIANAGDSRLFLVIQTGQILVYKAGAVLATPFLDISSTISYDGDERGLLSVAFHPQYLNPLNGYFFVYYTNISGNPEISRYNVMTGNADVADPASAKVLLSVNHPTNANHNGGQLQFGPDGFLYMGTGDGGSANDPPCNAQNDNVALGKLLRIDVNPSVYTTPPYYAIPPSNPHYSDGNITDPFQLAWAKGLRNPWRFSFDSMTGDLWIGDVGQDNYEEIDFQPQATAVENNYGWKYMEGDHCGLGDPLSCSATPPPCSPPSPLFTAPVFEYDHGGGRCAVMGGYVYRGSQDPNLFGLYLYTDLCSGTIWASGQVLAASVGSPTTFGEDSAGELYIGTNDGNFYRILHVASAPTPTPSPSPTITPTTFTPTPSRGVFLLHGRFRPTPPDISPR